MIVVANHPATMMDPLNAAANFPRMVNFLANSSLFKTRFNSWFFSTLYCIPIERYIDTGGKPINNDKAFEKASEHLSKGGVILMCPEGTSFSERHLRPIKTGCARIAFAAERMNDFKLGLRILPIGLTYDDGVSFRDRVVINFGEPIEVSKFQKEEEKKVFGGVRALTKHIEAAFDQLIVNAKDKTQDLLLRDIETILQTEQPLNHKNHFFRAQKLAQQFKNWEQQQVDTVNAFTANATQYFQQLSHYKITDWALKHATNNYFKWLILLLFSPVFLIGYLNHFVANYIPYWIAQKYVVHACYYPTFKSLSGLFIYPMVYGLQAFAVAKITGYNLYGWLYLIMLFPLGYFTEWYQKVWKKTTAQWYAVKLKKVQSQVYDDLLSLRMQLWAQLQPLGVT